LPETGLQPPTGLCLAKTLADYEIDNIAATLPPAFCYNSGHVNLVLLWFGGLFRLFRNRRDLLFENFVLRQQLAVLKRRGPRPSLSIFDKLFWIAVRRFWPKWKQALIVVTPETVVRLAPGRFSGVLEVDLESQEANWAKTDSEGSSRVDLPDRGRESDLGSTADSWRASHAGF
jgi:hypothetical protein